MSAALLLLTLLHAGPAEPDTTLQLARGASIGISSFAAAVTVHVGSDDMLLVRNGTIDGSRNSVDVEGDGPLRPPHGALDVTIPAWAKVSIDTYSGNITIDGGVARLDASTIGGNIVLKGGSGSTDLESINGSITVSDFHGDHLGIDATGGTVMVTGSSGAFEIESVNGAIRMRDAKATSVSASTVNEAIEYSGTIDPKGRYEFESHNGGILLSLPTDVSARMKVSTFNGAFSTEIPARSNGTADTAAHTHHMQGREFTVVYGRGDAEVSLDSFNGEIQVRRYRPR